jgi:hypothetical protein
MDLDNDKLDFGALPPEIDRLLQQGVASHFTDPAAAEASFRAAITLDPTALSAYRCLVKHQNRQRQFASALLTVHAWLTEASRQAGLDTDWQNWTTAPASALAALKALAFIELRSGRPDAAAAALAVLQKLDPADGLGGSVIAALLPEAETA